MQKAISVFLCSFFFVFSGFSQGIKGRIVNKAGGPVPYATVYVSELHRGTTANEHGDYHLTLPPGNYEVRFQYLGYMTQTRVVEIDTDYQTIDIEFEEQQYRLPEVIITASGEDPAYYIMRRAIGMSQYYLNQISAYTCRVYLKGSGVVKSMPALMRRQMERDGVEEGRYFVTETISTVSFELPDRYRTEVESVRSSGDDNQSSPMAFVTISLYRDINGIISPLSRDAFRVYRFTLEGSFLENGDQINKIRVTPRRPGPDLYNGTIFIREGGWNLHSVDLMVSQSMFNIGIRQVYNPVADGVWMPVSHNFDMALSLLGFEVDFTYLASVSDFELTLNPGLDHDFYLSGMGYAAGSALPLPAKESLPVQQANEGMLAVRKQPDSVSVRQQQINALLAVEDMNNLEMRRVNRLIRKEARAARPRESLELFPANMEIADSARTRSREYWDANRPVILTDEELESFNEAPADTSATPGKKNAGGQLFRKLVTGSRYKLTDQWSLLHNGILGLSSYGFNTVDGFWLSQKITGVYTDREERRLSISARASYAFSRKKVLPEAEVTYNYHPYRRASLSLSGGRASSDFNELNGIPPMFNTLTSLYFKQNFMKLYEKDFIKIGHRTDILNGLVLFTGAEYAKRRRLENNNAFALASIFGKTYSPNLPPYNGLPLFAIENHDALTINALISYTPRYYYRMAGRRKQMLYSKYPTLDLGFRQGIKGLWGSDAGYVHLEASLSQTFSLRLIGQFTYKLTAGTFFDNDRMFFADYKHFNTNPLWVKGDNSPWMFRTLPYYSHSTAGDYATAHFQYDHSRILLKRLPFLAGKLIREKVFFNGLLTGHQAAWTEFGYGLDQLFLVLSLEVVTGFSGGRHQYTGIRLGIPLSNAITLSL